MENSSPHVLGLGLGLGLGLADEQGTRHASGVLEERAGDTGMAPMLATWMSSRASCGALSVAGASPRSRVHVDAVACACSGSASPQRERWFVVGGPQHLRGESVFEI
eukprot:6204534-Pleurochrysis_carterae.AAC.3